jgi:eukaryotic-like serine/threonine-protein kinase
MHVGVCENGADVYRVPRSAYPAALKLIPIQQAIVDLEAAAPYELNIQGNLYPAYVRGQAYLLARNGTAAGVEFQKLLDHRGVVQNWLTGALAHLQIGRGYTMAGDTVKAKSAYQDFFTL